MSTDLIKYDLAAPEQAMKVAEILQRFVKEKKLTANIKGKEYPLVEAWCYAGSQLGLYPILTKVSRLMRVDAEIAYEAFVEIRKISDDKVMSLGYAVCSNKEASKRSFDEYAICSMAQTRAEGKAFRMLLSWIMKAAGFEATPAEEMDFTNDEKQNGKTTLYNHKEIGAGLPLIKNGQFKKACERIAAGELDLFSKVIADFSMTKEQVELLKSTYEKSLTLKVNQQ